MKALKKSVIASFAVQGAMLVIWQGSYWLPPEFAQSAVFLIFPFVMGIAVGPMLMRPLVGTMSPEVQLDLAIVASLVSNFIVYAAIFYMWFTIRTKVYRKNLPAMAA
jgi:hypothetical protein